MGDKKLQKIDGVLWNINYPGNTIGNVEALCPIHRLRLKFKAREYHDYNTDELFCDECSGSYKFKRFIADEKRYVLDKLDSLDFKNMEVINIDNESIPILKSNIKSKNNKYFIKEILTDSKVGKRLVIYVGEKGRQKSQIFIEPEIKRLAFDQNDLHPADIFLKLEAVFEDGSTMSINKEESKKKK